MEIVQTADGLIDRFGGTTKTSVIFGVLPSAVSNWRKTGFPARLHYRASKEADARGIPYAETVFAQAQPEAAA